MLQRLIIKNYAIIDHLTLEPDRQLNIVTGETGAGKSIILGALSLILGERADTGVLINKEEKLVVEGYFNVAGNEAFNKALAAADIDADDQCIIRREVSPGGKSRAFVNDTPVNLAILNQLTSLLVDLHQQFDHHAIGAGNFQVLALDALAGTTPQRLAYSGLFQHYRRIKRQLADQLDTRAKLQKEADYKLYLLEELTTANFTENEVEDAAVQLKQLSHSEKILQVLAAANYALDEGEQPILNELKRMSQQLQHIADVMPALRPVLERLTSTLAELKDISGELEDMRQSVNLDPEVMETLQHKVDLGYKLFKKHGLTSTSELLQLQHSLNEELSASVSVNEAIDRLMAEEEKLGRELSAAAGQLSAERKKHVDGFIQKMNELLVLVGMPNARFDIAMNAIEPGPMGGDDIVYLLDANKSGRYQPIEKAASGGEMSRIMLCIKSLTARALHLPTLIFDEVDTGISGEAARQVGLLLRELAGFHQVICITHQPQVAARGTRHFYVFKQADKAGKLTTSIKTLEDNERVLAIARMIGGEQPSEAAISNARELVAC